MTEQYSSPDHVRLSLAAAMSLDLAPGLFYRNARLGCINILLTYPEGCSGNCAYCGLSSGRVGEYEDKSFIRVAWDVYPLDDVVARTAERERHFGRVCVSMVTHPNAPRDMEEVVRRVRRQTDLPISVLITPTILSGDDLAALKVAGADRVGIAIDAAREDIFDETRGSGAPGPHRWDRYWRFFEDAIDVFGDGMVGSHFIVGLGETEEEMSRAIQAVRDLGGTTHLFSFFAEPDSALTDHPQPPIGQYRRIQLARYLIDDDISTAREFEYDAAGAIVGFGVADDDLEEIIRRGDPFMTSGCPGVDGRVACNRPFANSLPGPNIRNFPFRPDEDDLKRVMRELGSRGPEASTENRRAARESVQASAAKE